MPRDAAELAHRLARVAEAVCRHYLSNGKREGRYWLVGDVRNTPGRSMFVRLQDSPKGPAGKAIALSPRLGDFNEDLHVFGLDALRAALRIQLAPEDIDRFLLPSTAPE